MYSTKNNSVKNSIEAVFWNRLEKLAALDAWQALLKFQRANMAR